LLRGSAGRFDGSRISSKDGVDFERNKFSGQAIEPHRIAPGDAGFDHQIPALFPAMLSQSVDQRLPKARDRGVRGCQGKKHTEQPLSIRVLGAQATWPCRGAQSQSRNELAPPHALSGTGNSLA
jgi:hypothetical protein